MSATRAARAICVHIGTHKTGTTSIQAFIATNSEMLRAQGLYVPRSGMIHPRSGHHNLAWQLRGDPRFVAARGGLDELLRELAAVPEPRAVVSSEDFEYLVEYPERLVGFERVLRESGWEPWYLVLLRDQRGYAASLHGELIGHGLTLSYPRFVAEILLRAKFVMHGDWCFHFDYAAFLDGWRRAATGEMRARRFVKAGVSGLLIAEFLDAVGVAVPAGGIDRAERLNPRRTDPGGPARRIADLLIKARFAMPNARVRRRFGVGLG